MYRAMMNVQIARKMKKINVTSKQYFHFTGKSFVSRQLQQPFSEDLSEKKEICKCIWLSTGKQGDNIVCSVGPSVCVYACISYIRGSACRVQPNSTTLKFGAKRVVITTPMYSSVCLSWFHILGGSRPKFQANYCTVVYVCNYSTYSHD